MKNKKQRNKVDPIVRLALKNLKKSEGITHRPKNENFNKEQYETDQFFNEMRRRDF